MVGNEGNEQQIESIQFGLKLWKKKWMTVRISISKFYNRKYKIIQANEI